MNDLEQLDVLIPPVRELDLDGLKVRVKPLVIRQLSVVAKALQRIPQAVLDDLLAGQFNLLDIAAHSDVLVDVCAAATDSQASALGELTPDRLGELLAVLFEVNADFFMARLAPAMESLVAVTSRLMNRIGSMPSNGSAATAIPATTS